MHRRYDVPKRRRSSNLLCLLLGLPHSCLESLAQVSPNTVPIFFITHRLILVGYLTNFLSFVVKLLDFFYDLSLLLTRVFICSTFAVPRLPFHTLYPLLSAFSPSWPPTSLALFLFSLLMLLLTNKLITPRGFGERSQSRKF
jgi:hypothetical protein